MRQISFILILLLSSWGYGQSSLKDTVTSVLFIGNSYTHMNDMPSIFEKIAKAKDQRVLVEKSTKSGASLEEHSQREGMYKAIKSRPWDIVVLQGFSREFSFPQSHIDSATIPYLAQIIDSIRTNHINTQILFYMTWGYKEGYKEIEAVDTYPKMAQAIIDGYQYASEYFCLPIAPVGQVWRDIRNYHPQLNLYDADMAHPNRNGSFLAASTFYSAIFNESAYGAITSTIGLSEAQKIHRSVAKIVLADPQNFMLNEINIGLRQITHVDGTYHLYASTSIPFIEEIRWDFGDGQYSNKINPSHEYKYPGSYQIRVSITFDGQVRHYVRNIYFKGVIKPEKNPKKSIKKGNKPFKKI